MAEKRAIDQISSSFSQATAKDWTQIAQKEIENKNPWEALAWSDQENLIFKPYYDAEIKNQFVFALPTAKNAFYGARAWYNMPLVRVDNATNANDSAMLHLSNGAECI